MRCGCGGNDDNHHYINTRNNEDDDDNVDDPTKGKGFTMLIQFFFKYS